MSWLDGISAGLTAGTQGAAGYMQGQQKGREDRDKATMQMLALLRQKRQDEQNALMASAQMGNLKSLDEERKARIDARLNPAAKPETFGTPFKGRDAEGEGFFERGNLGSNRRIEGVSPIPDRVADPNAGYNTRKQRVQVTNPDGTTTFKWLLPGEEATSAARVGGAAGGVGRPPTGEQLKSHGFARRMIAADPILRELEDAGKKTIGVEAARSVVPFASDAAANALSSPAQQQYRTAGKEFGSAQLRQESGAAIPDPEWKQIDDRYLRVLFDKRANIEQKRTARVLAVKMMVKAAGPSWSPEDAAAFNEYLAKIGETPPAPTGQLETKESMWNKFKAQGMTDSQATAAVKAARP